MSAAQLSELRRPDAGASRPVLLSIDKVGFSVPAGSGKLTILEDLSLEVREGEFVSIIGGSGCGKTHLASSDRRPEFAIVGNDQVRRRGGRQAFAQAGRCLSGLHQGPVAVADRGWDIKLALDLEDSPADTHAATIDRLLHQVGLSDAADRVPRQLSGGMQQRLQIARCLALEPKVLLMDEPFGALDAITRQNLQDEVSRLAKQTGMTVIFITHDIEEATYLGDRVVAMESRPGRISAVLDINLPRPRDQFDHARG